MSDLDEAFQDRRPGVPAGLLPVGAGTTTTDPLGDDVGSAGTLCIACAPPDTGKVFFRPDDQWNVLTFRVEPNETTLHRLSDSWDQFLSQLRWSQGTLATWKEAIVDGDLPKLQQWLDLAQSSSGCGRCTDLSDIALQLAEIVAAVVAPFTAVNRRPTSPDA